MQQEEVQLTCDKCDFATVKPTQDMARLSLTAHKRMKHKEEQIVENSKERESPIDYGA